MREMYEEINTHLLVAILKTQAETLKRLDELTLPVARPPLKVYEPKKLEDHR